MIKSMIVRDLKSRYSGSIMGLFWAVIHPFMMVITYAFIFSIVFKAKLGPEAGTTSFTLWLLSGMLPWFLFSDSIVRSAGIIIENKPLITKTIFPSEILPIIVFFTNLVNHFIIFCILIIILIFVGEGITPAFLLLPFYLIMISMFSVGLGWIISSVNVFIRDVGQFLMVIINIWFWYTPIVYQSNKMSGNIKILLQINPMYHIVEGYRNAILGRNIISIAGTIYVFVLCVSTFIIGAIIFRRLKPNFADIL